MSKAEDFGSFISENKDLLKDYVETRMEIYRLQAVKTLSKTAGMLLWIIISVFLIFLATIFIGIVLGFWFSQLFNSYVWGFGLTTLLLIVVIVLIALFRRQLFINPIIRGVISQSHGEVDDKEYEPNL